MGGWLDEWVGGWMDGWIIKWMDRALLSKNPSCSFTTTNYSAFISKHISFPTVCSKI